MITKRKTKTANGRKGLLITFEGIDGSGKSTQVRLAKEYLIAKTKREIVVLREPGSTAVSETIRAILLDKRNQVSDFTELLLYEAARAQLVNEELRPLLEQGVIVLCDRFFDSTTAYQGYGRGLDKKLIQALNLAATGKIVPHLTLVYDLPLSVALTRRGPKADRLESEKAAFHKRVRAGFLKIAKQEPRRVKVINSTGSLDDNFAVTTQYLDTLLKRHE